MILQCEALISEVVLEYKVSIPPADYNTINNYLAHGEWGLAFELLCTVLEQDEIGITSVNYEKLVELGTYFEYDSILWDGIQIVYSK
ncbi:TPA: MafI family immunity protein [Streptococcus suis]|nr:MafI family immunity protein [Streptococcus suis]